LRRERCNSRYLPGAAFPAKLQLEPDLAAALRDCHDVLVAVPSHGFRAMLEQIKPHLRADTRVAWATKGFELSSGKLPFAVATEVLGARPLAVLSGPTFAKEVGAGLPTAMTIASADAAYAQKLARSVSGPAFRAYTQADYIGVEVGGAVKNVIAIATGIADGMRYGANTRVALITRGLAEMMRLGARLGAKRDTFMGLAGLGDLVLTCTDDQSRNRRFGVAMGLGARVADAQSSIGQVVEGVTAARAVVGVAAALQVEMPICQQVHAIIHEGRGIAEAVQSLMSREIRAEGD
jgi:glycerol-3-phosphate dehydrogenase (NAD(P)+)